jgi:hypothetical protein
VSTCFGASFIYERFFFPKTIIISIFGGISKFLTLIVFRQVSVKLGSFGQYWIDFVAMAVVESMPSFERKKIKNHN